MGNHINGNTSVTEALIQPKGLNRKKVSKFYCDIEAALAGEISDVEDDKEPVIARDTSLNKVNELSNDNPMLRTSALFAKQKISLVEEQLKKSKQYETRIVRYPIGKPLALNIIHKVYVIELEGAHAWVRLCDGDRPPCFDAAHVTLKAAKPLEWEELIPGTPCVVLARFNPLDIVNDGISRELTEFESYARAIVEECNHATKTATVRLVDYGFRLTQLDNTAIKPLTIAFDGPPLAIRLQIDLLPKKQKDYLQRYATLCIRLTVSREKQFLCWSKTWKAIDVQKQNWNKENSDCSSSIKSAEMHNLNDQQCASPSFGLVARAFVSSWLNKDHKRAGGPGIEAALCGITKSRSEYLWKITYYLELPPSEFALNGGDDESLESTQSSDKCFTQPSQNPITKKDSDWPVLTYMPKVSLQLSKKKEGKKKGEQRLIII
uniref:Uncharacterized protein n=1 Tax=Setaria digitata TaxID=48799 RepID=A0A915PRT0_9BILA